MKVKARRFAQFWLFSLDYSVKTLQKFISSVFSARCSENFSSRTILSHEAFRVNILILVHSVSAFGGLVVTWYCFGVSENQLRECDT